MKLDDVSKEVFVETFVFLDVLRNTGVCNMFGATPYIAEEFPDLSQRECKGILLAWMESFDESEPPEQRAEMKFEDMRL
jgi:hypothetical protein